MNAYAVNHGINKYKTTQVQTSSPIDLILLTYDALNQALYKTQAAIANNDLEREAEFTGLTLEILIELITSLDMERGGEIAAHLSVLYSYMYKILSLKLCTNDQSAVNEVQRLSKTLREGWMLIK